jgi:hypothetical protein
MNLNAPLIGPSARLSVFPLTAPFYFSTNHPNLGFRLFISHLSFLFTAVSGSPHLCNFSLPVPPVENKLENTTVVFFSFTELSQRLCFQVSIYLYRTIFLITYSHFPLSRFLPGTHGPLKSQGIQSSCSDRSHSLVSESSSALLYCLQPIQHIYPLSWERG